MSWLIRTKPPFCNQHCFPKDENRFYLLALSLSQIVSIDHAQKSVSISITAIYWMIKIIESLFDGMKRQRDQIGSKCRKPRNSEFSSSQSAQLPESASSVA
jgi:hypothetical protein